MIHKISWLLFSVCIFVLLSSSNVEAKPLNQSSTTLIRICYSDPTCANPSTGTDLNTLSGYVQHVLANEWPGDANLDAMKAGAIAIRTFVYRTSPCGAFLRTYTESSVPPVTSSRLPPLSVIYYLCHPFLLLQLHMDTLVS